MIYFIRAVGTNRVKIGQARDVAHRLRRLQTGCPFPLTIERTLSGGHMEERELHLRFSTRRRQGEWFEMTPDEVAGLCFVSRDARESPPVEMWRGEPLPRWGAKEVYRFRPRLGMSQSEFADHVETRQATVSRWETGVVEASPIARRLLTLLSAEDN